MPSLIDSHCHLDNPVFFHDRDEIVQNALKNGVIAQIIPSTSARYWPRVHEVTTAHTNVFATYGLHPLYMHHHDPGDVDLLAQFLRRTPSAVGIGECGLDYFMQTSDKRQQQDFFAQQLLLARELSLPIVIHARKAVEDVIDLIRSTGHNKGMVHSFNGSAVQAGRLIDLGYSMSFGGAVTYDRAKKLRKLVASLPLDAILLETDSPDQPDAKHHGERNQPAWLVDVFETVCSLRAETADEIAAATSKNAIDLFALSLQ